MKQNAFFKVKVKQRLFQKKNSIDLSAALHRKALTQVL